VIEARQFVEAARAFGFEWYAGVPCSFLTPFINYVLQDKSLHYLSMANEGDAVALLAGVALGATGRKPRRGIAMMQNSGLGNAVSPLTSLTWTFRLPQLLIVTWRGQPGVNDEPQHALMGPMTPQLLELMQIPWELFPREEADIVAALERAVAHMNASGRPYALVMPKGVVAPVTLSTNSAPVLRSQTVAAPRPRDVPAERATRQQALAALLQSTVSPDTIVLASTGYCGRELYALADRPNHFYMVGSMGCVTALALGLALSRPQLRVVAVDGDGAALMRMGTFASIGAYAPHNLWHLLLDNGVHDSTGGQATVSAGVGFAAIAAACGYPLALESDGIEVIDELFAASNVAGPRFAHLRTKPGAAPNLPRPSVTPEQVSARLAAHIGAKA
jgi:phosphonopyruvate decarboxylase